MSMVLLRVGELCELVGISCLMRFQHDRGLITSGEVRALLSDVSQHSELSAAFRDAADFRFFPSLFPPCFWKGSYRHGIKRSLSASFAVR
jgi:hypothetical protein